MIQSMLLYLLYLAVAYSFLSYVKYVKYVKKHPIAQGISEGNSMLKAAGPLPINAPIATQSRVSGRAGRYTQMQRSPYYSQRRDGWTHPTYSQASYSRLVAGAVVAAPDLTVRRHTGRFRDHNDFRRWLENLASVRY